MLSGIPVLQRFKIIGLGLHNGTFTAQFEEFSSNTLPVKVKLKMLSLIQTTCSQISQKRAKIPASALLNFVF